MSNFKFTPMVSAAAIVIAMGGGSAIAQEAVLDEITVTATKRSENLQDVPMSVSAFTSETIENANIFDAQDVVNLTPSMTMGRSRNPFQNRLAIRGIGTSQNDPSLEPSVGMFIDGAYLGRTGLGMNDLVDIERIETLQGPQGTLYGKNTNAGAINIITKRPSLDEAESSINVTAGSFGAQKVTLMTSQPISDDMAYRISGNINKRDGYFNNVAGADPADADDWNLQGKLLWEASDALSVLFNVSLVERDTNGGGVDVKLSNPVKAALTAMQKTIDDDPYNYDIAINTPSKFDLESDSISMYVDYETGNGTITSITAYNDYDYFTQSDADNSELDIMRNLGEANSGDSLSQELRFDSSYGDNIDYQLGLFYHSSTTQRGDGSNTYEIGNQFHAIGAPILLSQVGPAGFRPAWNAFLNGLKQSDNASYNQIIRAGSKAGDTIGGKNIWESETLAVFGQATYHASDNLHITAGLRWSDEEKDADLFVENTTTATGLTPANMQTIAAGFFVPNNVPAQVRPIYIGTLNSVYVDSVTLPIDAELSRTTDNTDWMLSAAYDLDDNSMVYVSAATGSKSGNFNGVNSAPEDREFDDEKTMSYELGLKSTMLDQRLRLNVAAFMTEIEDFQFQVANPATGGSTVSNAGEVDMSGIDLSLQALPIPNLTLEAGLVYMDTYDMERNGTVTDMVFTADLSGNLAATFVIPRPNGSIYIRGDYVFMGDHWTKNGARSEAAGDYDDREVVNLTVGRRLEKWNVSVWGKNLTDDEYATGTNNAQPFSGNKAFVLAAPRTFGVSLQRTF